MSKDDDLRKLMIKNTNDELEELEKGIVLASIEIDKMQSMPTTDLSVSAQIRLRREQLEEEYELAKRRLSDLQGGNLPSPDKARERIQKARYNLREANKDAEELASKQKEAQDEIYDDD